MSKPRICNAKEPQGRGRCGLYAPHPNKAHQLLRADHPKDEARAYEKVAWVDLRRGGKRKEGP
jgi:hypothetical protein